MWPGCLRHPTCPCIWFFYWLVYYYRKSQVCTFEEVFLIIGWKPHRGTRWLHHYIRLRVPSNASAKHNNGGLHHLVSSLLEMRQSIPLRIQSIRLTILFSYFLKWRSQILLGRLLVMIILPISWRTQVLLLDQQSVSASMKAVFLP